MHVCVFPCVSAATLHPMSSPLSVWYGSGAEWSVVGARGRGGWFRGGSGQWCGNVRGQWAVSLGLYPQRPHCSAAGLSSSAAVRELPGVSYEYMHYCSAVLGNDFKCVRCQERLAFVTITAFMFSGFMSAGVLSKYILVLKEMLYCMTLMKIAQIPERAVYTVIMGVVTLRMCRVCLQAFHTSESWLYLSESFSFTTNRKT